MIKMTLVAIKQNILINVITLFLLSALFCAELSLYYYFYYSYSVIEARKNTNFQNSTYIIEFDNSITKNTVDEIIAGIPTEIKDYEDVVIRKRLVESDSSTDLICFYNGMSLLHDFKSDSTLEPINDRVFETEKVLGANEMYIKSSREFEGVKYRIIELVSGLTAYTSNSEVFCCSSDEFWRITSNIDRIYIEYKTPLNKKNIQYLQQYFETFTNKPVISPSQEIERSIISISNISSYIIEVMLFMFIVTSCVIPIINYCIGKRHYEFSAYRMCGASQSFISYAEMFHILMLGTGSIIIGSVLLNFMFDTTGFWIIWLFTVVIFIVRQLLEALIDSKSSKNIVEVNKKWKL